jgi:hypothetical protein
LAILRSAGAMGFMADFLGNFGDGDGILDASQGAGRQVMVWWLLYGP